MKRNLRGFGLGALAATALLFAMDLPADTFADRAGFGAEDLFKSCMNNMKKDCQSWAASGGGSEAPRGLGANTMVELAINEKYVLMGTVEINGGQVYLRIDFHKHPWLANRTRMRNPYYRIVAEPAIWKKYAGKHVKIVATAHYATWNDRGKTVLEINLEPGAEPVISSFQ